MKTAIYGGSFNPPHPGHTAAAETVARELRPDRFLIVPDCIAPHKQMAENSPPPEHRLQMCRLAFKDVPNAEVSDIEISRGGRSYTIDTLGRLREIYPEDEFILVIGSDMLLSFTTGWYRFEDILKMCSLAVVSREENDLAELETFAGMLREKHGAKVEIIKNHDALVRSSSEIRSSLKNGGGEELLSPEVYSYIKENNLYI